MTRDMSSARWFECVSMHCLNKVTTQLDQNTSLLVLTGWMEVTMTTGVRVAVYCRQGRLPVAAVVTAELLIRITHTCCYIKIPKISLSKMELFPHIQHSGNTNFIRFFFSFPWKGNKTN